MYGLHALCSIKVHGQDLRDDMCANIERLLDEGKEARLTALLDGLSGLANQGNIKDSQTKLGKKLLKLANDKLQPLPEHGLSSGRLANRIHQLAVEALLLANLPELSARMSDLS